MYNASARSHGALKDLSVIVNWKKRHTKLVMYEIYKQNFIHNFLVVPPFTNSEVSFLFLFPNKLLYLLIKVIREHFAPILSQAPASRRWIYGPPRLVKVRA